MALGCDLRMRARSRLARLTCRTGRPSSRQPDRRMAMERRGRDRRTAALVPSIVISALVACGPVAAASMSPREAPPGGNNPPHADAGPNQRIGAQYPALGVHVTLDGRASFDPDFDFLTFSWSDAPSHVIGTGQTLALTLYNTGTTHYALTVCDTSSACSAASVSVEVVYDFTPPVVHAPDLTTGLSGATGTRGGDGG